MSFKTSLLAGAAAAALLTPFGMTATASAATPSCGHSCLDLFSHQFGTFADPQFVMDSFKQGDKAGTPVILFRTSNADPAEDFTVDNQGLTSQFFAAGLVSSAFALHYGCTDAVFGNCSPTSTNPADTGTGYNFEAYEFMYTPFGVQTGLCTGVLATAVAGEKVTLQPCGVSGKTIWVAADLKDNCTTILNTIPPEKTCVADPTGLESFAQPLVNGSDTNFSQPFALTYPGTGYPTDEPRPQMYTANLTGFSSGALTTNQLWSADAGILP